MIQIDQSTVCRSLLMFVLAELALLGWPVPERRFTFITFYLPPFPT